jgi:hypothetical protein
MGEAKQFVPQLLGSGFLQRAVMPHDLVEPVEGPGDCGRRPATTPHHLGPVGDELEGPHDPAPFGP